MHAIEGSTTPSLPLTPIAVPFDGASGRLSEEWRLVSGEWRIAGGFAHPTEPVPSTAVAVLGTVELGAEWTIRARCRTEAGTRDADEDWCGILGDFLGAPDEEVGYHALRVTATSDDGNGPVVWELVRVIDGAPALIVGGELSGFVYMRGRVGIDLQLSRSGDRFHVVIEDARGTILVDTSATAPPAPLLRGGRAGILSTSTRGRVADFALTTSTPSVRALPRLNCDRHGTPVSTRALADVDAVSRVGTAWAGMVVTPCLLTHDLWQYLAFWDDARRLVVARRLLPEGPWASRALPTELGWDSHNLLALGVDRDGALHISGNMHNVPLLYFRSAPGGDLDTISRVPMMVDRMTEQSVTYPEFITRADGSLLFSHRDGRSGSGTTYFNSWDERTSTWSRLTDVPLFDGLGSDEHPEATWSAYFVGPTLGPDGRFHLLWVWRGSPDCSTNSMLSYARSPDLLTWEDGVGDALAIPFRFGEADVVDPVPERGGLLNGNARLGFLADGTVIASYHKYDPDGRTQLYVATRGEDGWSSHAITDWQGRWQFDGGGTIEFQVAMLGSIATPDGGAQVLYRCRGANRAVVLDASLQPVDDIPITALPDSVTAVRSEYPGMQVNIVDERKATAGSPVGSARYAVRWESLGENRDRPRSEWPREGSPIEVLRLVTTEGD